MFRQDRESSMSKKCEPKKGERGPLSLRDNEKWIPAFARMTGKIEVHRPQTQALAHLST